MSEEIKISETDLGLQLALAKMLPEKIEISAARAPYWINEDKVFLSYVKETEMLHICWLIEQGLFLNTKDWASYVNLLVQICAKGSNTFPRNYLHATWQQRAAALIATKGEK